MKKLLLAVVCLGVTGVQAQKLSDAKTAENWYYFKNQQTAQLKMNEFVQNYSGELGLRSADVLTEKRKEKDRSGRVHVFYSHTIAGIPVEGSVLAVHSGAGERYAETVNDKLTKNVRQQSAVLSVDAALKYALSAFPSEKYAWQDAAQEAELKQETRNASATHYPRGELVYAKAALKEQTAAHYRLCYRVTIFSAKPFFKKAVYIDAETGSLFKTAELILNCNDAATATTLYNGNQQIMTDWKGWPWNRYILIDCNNRNIHTKYGSGTNPEAENGSTSWGTSHQAATSGHWAAEMTWDLYRLVYGRNGTNNSNREVKVLVDHPGEDDNASYEFSGGNNDKIRIGRTTIDNRSLATLDVVGHEITHGLTHATAELEYEGQSGALNESFSDIFGFMVERRAEGAVNDWIIGEDYHPFGGLRSLLNPNAFGDPAIVGDSFWYTGTDDHGGVHTNSGVPNRWFSILSTGGVQNGVTVNAIGIDVAALIAWHTLVFHLTEFSNFNDARNASINVARSLFGECSNQLIQTTNAWAAVGVGNAWQVQNINLVAEYGQDCSVVNVFANVPSSSAITWTTTNGLLINGQSSPHTVTGNLVTISSPSGQGGTVSATLTGCQANALEVCICSPWDGAAITWVYSAPAPNEPLQAYVSPDHPNAISYNWYVNGQLIANTGGTFLSSYYYPCTSEGEGLSVVAVTTCGVSMPVYGGTYNPICYGRVQTGANIKVFPNPATSVIGISLDQAGMAPNAVTGAKPLQEITQVKVMDKLGLVKKMFRFSRGSRSVTLNVSDLPADVYYLDISDGKQQQRVLISIRR